MYRSESSCVSNGSVINTTRSRNLARPSTDVSRKQPNKRIYLGVCILTAFERLLQVFIHTEGSHQFPCKR